MNHIYVNGRGKRFENKAQHQKPWFSHHKCRESWPNIDYERAYNLLLDAVLLVLPLAVLSATYSLITRILYQGMMDEQTHCVRNEVKGCIKLHDRAPITTVRKRYRLISCL
uniref:Uncharacterized protein n=1 Tax=Timema shepardi TaxID=629360 RepID=A0A7R9B561_TIMSH|nr:unnamed protein product [Timema shepardi]